MPDGGRSERLIYDPDITGQNSPPNGPPTPELELMAEVVLGGGVGERTVYSYRVPKRLADRLCPGHLVEVPFGTRVLQGIVLSIDYGTATGIRLRDVSALLDPFACLTMAQIDLAQWIAAYYVCGINDAIDLMLPPGLERAQVTTYEAAPHRGMPMDLHLTPMQLQVLNALRERGATTATRLLTDQPRREVTAALDSLVRTKLVERSAALGRASVGELTETVVVLQPRAAWRLTSLQRSIVDYLEGCGGEATLASLRNDLDVDTSVVTRLATRRIVLTYTRQLRRDPLAHRIIEHYPAPALTVEQQQVYAPIHAAVDAQDGSIFLLHGVTGSGKTEVYLRAVGDALRIGKQAIILVPEIGLTPQTVSRFAGRFPGQVALLHSRLGDGERYDEWQRIRRGECAMAVGPRSAIFSPFPNIGLIVLDEEHDASYKQDRTPRYHTREVAEQLARATGAVVLLGSATPDVVSFNRADRGRYRLLTMRSRVRHPDDQSTLSRGPRAVDGLPPVRVVDMRLELKAGNRGIFSRALVRGIERTLERREQAIILLNRRGSATFVNCRDCGYVARCRRCDLPFAYHSDGNRLQCHRCDARAPVPTLCASCGSWRIRYFGLGTQKVEQELQTRFPRARIQRYDRDVTTGKLDHEAILDRFERGQIDLLVGTQIVSKGLNFPRVTLVGAVAADTSLNLPDFRAAERTFDLLTQVAGRAGRAELPGTVIVQTYTPSHFAIQAAANHDYADFYRNELLFRREANYPPFCQLARLIVSDRTEDVCRREATALAQRLEQWLVTNSSAAIEVIGPAPCFISKANNRYYWQIILRGQDVHPMLAEVPRGWAIDVDPVSLL